MGGHIQVYQYNGPDFIERGIIVLNAV